MYVNGEQISIQGEISLTLGNFLEKQGYYVQRVAVEKNGNIVPKKDFDIEMLSENDKLEIVRFVGGG